MFPDGALILPVIPNRIILVKDNNCRLRAERIKGELFVSMPRYRSNERDEKNSVIYKDVCNPITAEFREELYTNILVLPKDYAISIAVVFILFIAVVAGIWLYKIQKRFS